MSAVETLCNLAVPSNMMALTAAPGRIGVISLAAPSLHALLFNGLRLRPEKGAVADIVY